MDDPSAIDTSMDDPGAANADDDTDGDAVAAPVSFKSETGAKMATADATTAPMKSETCSSPESVSSESVSAVASPVR